ncbi:MAG: PQQ-like beta-propeller repeat protein [Planctomycetes bacterium]|nr:PQQ-like beta-propeller repeat protein [Planctomycetota bacterium]
MTTLPFCFALLAFAGDDPAQWPHWRGPAADGVALGAAPREWSDAQGVRWKVVVPGRGVSTPIVYGDALFLTTAVPTQPEAALAEEPAEEGRGRMSSGPPTEQSFELHCLERSTGATRWKAVARVATPHEGFHKSYGSFASASPVTDGQRVYVNFGSQGVYAYDFDGKLAWSFDPGVKLVMRNSFGEGLAPVLAGNVLVQVADQEQGSFAFALDKHTGKELWRVARDEPSTWATPLVTEVGGTLQVITAGTTQTRAYAPDSGKLLWQAPGVGVNAIPALVRAGELALVMSGYREAKIVALRLPRESPAAPDLGADALAWSATKGCAYTASPVLVDGLYYTVTDRGLISCFDAATGEAHYLEERLPRGSALKSSPIAAGEFLYVPTEAGEVHLIRLGPKYEVAGTNVLAEQVFVASPACAQGDLFLRSLTHLLCIGSDG